MKRREFIVALAGAIAAWPFAALGQQPAGGKHRRKLSLTSAQQTEIWHRLGTEAMKTQVPAGLKIGETVPDTMHLLSFTRALRKKVPALRSYVYALLQGQVLIIDPATRKIVSIVGQ